MDPRHDGSAAQRLAWLLDEDEAVGTDPASAQPDGRPLHRWGLASWDIDGLVSSMMLAASSAIRVVALVDKSERVRLHPSFDSLAAAVDPGRAFAIDLYGSLLDGVSNHPVFWGRRRLSSNAAAGALTAAYDETIEQRATTRVQVNASLWARIEAATTNSEVHLGADYRYPLGAAQLMLAVLEAIDRSPRLFDREFLPWLVANCDGGLETIRQYAFNVPMWWSAMAAAVGPGSISEQIYRLASEQRPNDFVSVDRRLRFEETDRAARALTEKWNLRDQSPETLAHVTEWIGEISGWPDPFWGGVASITDWPLVPVESGLLSLSGGLPIVDGQASIPEFNRHLTNSLAAFHTAFSQFDGRWRLGWMKAPTGT